MTSVFIKRRKLGHTDTDTRRKKGHVEMGAEIWRDAASRQGLLANQKLGDKPETDAPSETPEELTLLTP